MRQCCGYCWERPPCYQCTGCPSITSSNLKPLAAGEARSLLQQVELACAAVLNLDPGNAKAKHRQRQAAELLSLR